MSKKPVIIIVEHDPMLGMLLLEVLTDEGCATELWTERAGAFEYIRQKQPDLVVLDLWLHRRGDGWQVFDALRRDTATRGIPVILCADDPLLLQIEGAGRHAGAAIVLEKPFDLEQFLDLVAEIFMHDAQPSPRQAKTAKLPALAFDAEDRATLRWAAVQG